MWLIIEDAEGTEGTTLITTAILKIPVYQHIFYVLYRIYWQEKTHNKSMTLDTSQKKKKKKYECLKKSLFCIKPTKPLTRSPSDSCGWPEGKKNKKKIKKGAIKTFQLTWYSYLLTGNQNLKDWFYLFIYLIVSAFWDWL